MTNSDIMSLCRGGQKKNQSLATAPKKVSAAKPGEFFHPHQHNTKYSEITLWASAPQNVRGVFSIHVETVARVRKEQRRKSFPGVIGGKTRFSRES